MYQSEVLSLIGALRQIRSPFMESVTLSFTLDEEGPDSEILRDENEWPILAALFLEGDGCLARSTVKLHLECQVFTCEPGDIHRRITWPSACYDSAMKGLHDLYKAGRLVLEELPDDDFED